MVEGIFSNFVANNPYIVHQYTHNQIAGGSDSGKTRVG